MTEPSLRSIAIVDDDASVRSATVDLLSSLGFSCVAFASAEAYLESPELAQTACLIADVRMPGLGGLDLQQRLVKCGFAIPTIFITAFPEERARVQALKAGAICFLPKPYDERALLDCIDRAFGWIASRIGVQGT